LRPTSAESLDAAILTLADRLFEKSTICQY